MRHPQNWDFRSPDLDCRLRLIFGDKEGGECRKGKLSVLHIQVLEHCNGALISKRYLPRSIVRLSVQVGAYLLCAILVHPSLFKGENV